MSDPASEGYHLHLQANPDDLLGRAVVVSAIKRTCYSPDWHRNPEDYPKRVIRSHDEEKEILVYETEEYLGRVESRGNGLYHISRETDDGHRMISVPVSDVVHLIREGTWWAE